jgi:glycosyl transferase family 9 (putative heptosyltransferase)/tetratricopeptide repeat protein
MRDQPWLPGFRTREAKRAVASGMAAMELHEYERAEMLFRYAVDCYPRHFGAWVNLGNAAGNRGRHREAIRYYHQAHTLAPFDHNPRVNTAHAHLMLGEYRDGWSIYEERWRDRGFHARTSIPVAAGTELAKRWDGVAHPGRSLLIFNEQGAGDVLMMLRYWGLLEQTGMRVIYRVPANLWRLVRYNVPGSAQVVTDAEPVPPHDYHAAFMSLPYLFRTWAASEIPGAAGYLKVRPSPEVSSLLGYRVGLVWKGNPQHKGDRTRSMHDVQNTIVPLVLDSPNLTWVSLQLDAGVESPELGLRYFETLDYYETARIISGLDAVVAVDTGVAHLAGALGVPVLLMLGCPNDWRWQASGERTPWYDSVQLFRSGGPTQWGPVVDRVRRHLATLADVPTGRFCTVGAL